MRHKMMTEESISSTFSECVFHDVTTGQRFDVPISNDPVHIGLSVTGDLVVSRDSDYSASGIVIRLCVISFTPEGAWFIPERHLPSIINGDTVTSVTLLSKGAAVHIADRSLTFHISSHSGTDAACTSSTASPSLPPRKPQRGAAPRRAPSFLQQLELSSEQWRRCQPSGDTGDTNSRRMNASRFPVPDDLMMDPEDGDTDATTLATRVASTVANVLLLYADTVLSLAEVDHLFASIADVAEIDDAILTSFLTSHSAHVKSLRHREFRRERRSSRSIIRPLHEHTIALLTLCLQVAQEMEQHCIFWLKLLKTLAMFRENAATLKGEKTPAVVMGCMGVHTHCASVQQHACAILTSVAAFQSPAVGKVSVREAGVDYLCAALSHHSSDVLVVRPAIECLAVVVRQHSTFVDVMLRSADQLKKEETVEQCILSSVQLLDYVKDHALHLARTAKASFPADATIRSSATVVLNYYLETDLEEVSSLLSFESSTEQAGKFSTTQPPAQVRLEGEQQQAASDQHNGPATTIEPWSNGDEEHLTELEQLLVDSQVLTPSDSEHSDGDASRTGDSRQRVLRPALKSLSHKRTRLAKRVRFLCLTSPSSSSDEEAGERASSKENSIEVISVKTLGWSVVPFSATPSADQSSAAAAGSLPSASLTTDTVSTRSTFAAATAVSSTPYKELSVAPTFNGAYPADDRATDTTGHIESRTVDLVESSSSTDDKRLICNSTNITATHTSDKRKSSDIGLVEPNNGSISSSPSSPETEGAQCSLPELTTSHVRGDMPILQRKEGTKAYLQRVRPKQRVAYSSDTELSPFLDDQQLTSFQSAPEVPLDTKHTDSADVTNSNADVIITASLCADSDTMGNAHDAKVKVRGDDESGSHDGDDRTPNGQASSKSDHATPKARHKAAAKLIKRSSGVKTVDDLPASHADAVKELRRKFQDKDKSSTSADDDNNHVTPKDNSAALDNAGESPENEYQFPTIFVYSNLPKRQDESCGTSCDVQPPPLPPKSHTNNKLRDAIRPSADNKKEGSSKVASTSLNKPGQQLHQHQQQGDAAITRSISPSSEARLSTKCRSSPNMLQDAAEAGDAPPVYHRPSVTSVRQPVSHKGQVQGDSPDDDLLLDTSTGSVLQHRLETLRTLISGLQEKSKPSTVLLDDFTRSYSTADAAQAALLLDGLTIFINGQLDDVTPELHLKLLQMLASLIENDGSPVTVSRTCQLLVNCLQGAVLRSVQEGWGFFTMRRLKRSLAARVDDWETRGDISERQQDALKTAFDVVQSII